MTGSCINKSSYIIQRHVIAVLIIIILIYHSNDAVAGIKLAVNVWQSGTNPKFGVCVSVSVCFYALVGVCVSGHQRLYIHGERLGGAVLQGSSVGVWGSAWLELKVVVG